LIAGLISGIITTAARVFWPGAAGFAERRAGTNHWFRSGRDGFTRIAAEQFSFFVRKRTRAAGPDIVVTAAARAFGLSTVAFANDHARAAGEELAFFSFGGAASGIVRVTRALGAALVVTVGFLVGFVLLVVGSAPAFVAIFLRYVSGVWIYAVEEVGTSRARTA